MTVAVESELWRWQHGHRHAPAPSLEPLALEPVGFEDIPGWDLDDHQAAFECYRRSAGAASQPPITKDWIGRAASNKGGARSFFESAFIPHRIAAAPGLLTSYFEPMLKGSRLPSEAFPIPVYRRPPGLVPLPPGHPLAAAGFSAGQSGRGDFTPYFTRAEIEAGALAGQGLEILYLADPIEAFVMHIQGSGVIELEGEPPVRLGFDGKNGHPYTSISKLIVSKGHLSIAEAHLDGTIAWLRRQPDLRTWLDENKSYIFFKELTGGADAPLGSSGVALTAGRSLAADPHYHAPGTPVWVSSPDLNFDGKPLARLLVAQDTGSAITGPQRGDIFAGTGSAAGLFAGRVRHTCTFIVFKPRS